MTIPARITQADMVRAAKVAHKLGAGTVRLDYANRRIDIIFSEPGPAPLPAASEEWSDDDV